MTRRLFTALVVLALAACFGRVSAWAATAGPDHACCAGDTSSSERGPAVAECCATTAAVHAVKTAPAPTPGVVVATPVFAGASAIRMAVVFSAGPPGPQSFRAAVPARAPPHA